MSDDKTPLEGGCMCGEVRYLREGQKASTSIVLEERPFFESDAFPLYPVER